jgi:PAS domain S-box-containing protein
MRPLYCQGDAAPWGWGRGERGGLAGRRLIDKFTEAGEQWLLTGLVFLLVAICAMLLRALNRARKGRSALAAAERDYHSIFDNSLDGIYRSSPSGRQLRANPALVRLNGYDSEGEMLRSVNDIATEWYVEPGRRAEFMRELQDKGEVRDFVSEVWRHKTRERIWVSENARLVRDATGEPLFYEGSVRDITALKRAEEELVAARREAEDANRAKSHLLANVSHELRTPLNAIIGFSEIMESELLGPIGEPRYRAYAKDIRDSGLHLLAVINDLLDLSKIEAGRLELTDEIVDVGELFEVARRFLGQRPESAGLDLAIDRPAAAMALRGDQRALRQILLNLLSNAVKFTPPGGRVTLQATVGEDGGIGFRIADNGIGIAEPDIAKALEPFGLIESPLARKYPGTGLGLPITRALVELHGGRLAIESRLGRGTTVTVSLPPERTAATQTDSPRKPCQADGTIASASISTA